MVHKYNMPLMFAKITERMEKTPEKITTNRGHLETTKTKNMSHVAGKAQSIQHG